MNLTPHHRLITHIPKNTEDRLPIEIFDEEGSLSGAFVERRNIHYIPEDWDDICGFYVLFSAVNTEGAYSTYVGMTKASFYKRLKDHNDTKDWWNFALLMQKDSKHGGFTTTQALYLEGKAHEFFNNLQNVTVRNIKPTGDRTLSKEEASLLDKFILSMARIMKLRGYDSCSQSNAHQLLSRSEIHAEVLYSPDFSEQFIPIEDDYQWTPDMLNNDSNQELNLSQGCQSNILSDADLRLQLSKWRTEQARSRKVTPFIIMNNATLDEISEQRPQTVEALKKFKGFGSGKNIDLYGDAIIEIINNSSR